MKINENDGKSTKNGEKTPKIGKNSRKSIKIWLKWTEFRVRGFPMVRSTRKTFLATEKFSKKIFEYFFENFSGAKKIFQVDWTTGKPRI